MSDTPRTDDAEIAGEETWGQVGYVKADLARQLERELNALKIELEKAKADRNKAALQERQKYLPKLAEWKACAEELAAAVNYPNCSNAGWYSVRGRNDEEEQCECEFCATVENSKFKALERLKTLKESSK